jgi:tripartite ATP-independent transporter DctM subunit
MTGPERAWPRVLLARSEDFLATVAAFGVILLPLSEVVLRRWFSTGIAGQSTFAVHLTLLIGLIGASIAAREGKLLALATGTLVPEGPWRRVTAAVAALIGATVSAVLMLGGLGLVEYQVTEAREIAYGVKVWWFCLAFPIAFALIAVRLIWKAWPDWIGRIVMGVIAGGVAWYATRESALADMTQWPWFLVLLVGAVLGMPIFALLGGAALIVYLAMGMNATQAIINGLDQLTSGDLPAIPLFTMAGFLLAEGRSSERLLRFFRAFFGWMPGGTAVVTAVFCAFFTLFTGGSGVTILALGGLLLPALLADGYRERFSLGMLTAAGSLGLLFPPSLPLILYGIVAAVPISDLFIGGFVPGLLMLGALSAMGVREGLISKRPRQPFTAREAGASVWEAKWELGLPVVIIGSLLGGATTVQSSALAALYAFVVQRFIHRSVTGVGPVLAVMTKSIALVGGILIILAVARGFTDALTFANLPQELADWTTTNVQSPWVFLLGLNVVLIIVGAMMDIFSAVIIIVPLIVPIAAHFGIHPVHLGVIFIANSELGYLTPPVGENLFVASYRFNKPIMQLARAMVPMYVILLIGVLLITYWPWLTTGVLALFRGS